MTATGISCPTTSNSRRGRPLGETALAIRAAVEELTAEYDRMTVRQIFYQLEVAGVVEKTEGGYRQVQKQVLVMREKGLLAWNFITDGTRWRRKPDSHANAEAYINQIARTYRRDLWQTQGVRIEIWLEKDALADVISDVTYDWDVSLMVSRGQSSKTFLYSAGKAAENAWLRADVETHVYTMYDFDKAGRDAARKVAADLPRFASDAPVHVHQLAVTEEQIRDWSLQTREAKENSDERAVELDAIDPRTLVNLVENAILDHIDPHAWGIEKAVEEEERKGLLALARGWGETR